MGGRRWSDAEVALLVDNYNALPNEQLLELFKGRTYLSVYGKARAMGFYKAPEIVSLNTTHWGEKAGNWRGGTKRNQEGYIMELRHGHHRAKDKGYVMQHILVWEDFHGQRLPDGYVVHHINGIKDDNRPENLKAMLHGDHSRLENTGRKMSPEARKKISEGRRRYFAKQNAIARASGSHA